MAARRGVMWICGVLLVTACSGTTTSDGDTSQPPVTSVAADGSDDVASTNAPAPTDPPVPQVSIGSGPRPPVRLTVSTDVSDELAATPSWETVIPDGVVTSSAATADVVAVSLDRSGIVVGLDRGTGAEMWRYTVGPDQANVQLESRGDRIVVRVALAPTGQVLVELDTQGNPVWSWDSQQTGLSLLSQDGFGRYQSSGVGGGVVTVLTVDPDANPEVIDEVTGTAIGQGIGLFPVVALNGSVVLIDEVTRERVETGVVVDPDVESITYVDSTVVAYDEDVLTAFAIDGRPMWEGAYAAGPTDVTLHPVASSPAAVLIADLDAGATTVEAATGEVRWVEPNMGSNSPFPSGDGLFANFRQPDEVWALLDVTDGTVVVADSADAGPVDPTASGVVVLAPAGESGDRRTIWTDAAGEPVVWLIDASDIPDSSASGTRAHLKTEVVDGSSTLRLFEMPA